MSTEEPQAEITKGALVSFVWPDQSPLAVQDLKTAPPPPPPPPGSTKKKAKNKKGKITTEQVKAVGAGLKGFVDWLDPLVIDLTEEREEDMSSLAIKFTARMRKLVLRGRLPPDLKYMVENAQGCLA